MNQPLLNIASVLKNPQLRYPVMLVALLQIAKFWLPAYEMQLNGTQKVITYYLIAVAANSSPVPPAEPPTKV